VAELSSNLGTQALRSLVNCQNKPKAKEKVNSFTFDANSGESLIIKISVHLCIRALLYQFNDKSSTGYGITPCPTNTTKSDIKSRLPKRGF